MYVYLYVYMYICYFLSFIYYLVFSIFELAQLSRGPDGVNYPTNTFPTAIDIARQTMNFMILRSTTIILTSETMICFEWSTAIYCIR